MLQSNRGELISERFQGQVTCLRSRTKSWKKGGMARGASWSIKSEEREREIKTLSALNTAEQVRNTEARDDPIGRP